MDKQVQAATPAGAIFGKMVAVFKEIDAIGKTARNQSQGFNYRGIDDVYNAINPILAKHGVFMTAEVLSKTREERVTKRDNGKDSILAFTCLHMRYHFHAEDGSSVPTEAEGEGMDSGDKSSNKAMSVAHKYALLQAFCIPTKDLDDPDADSHEVAPKQNGNGAAPADDRQAPPADDTKRKHAAANWCYEAKDFVQKCEKHSDLAAWHKANQKAIDAAKTLAPNAAEALLTALAARTSFLAQAA